MRAHQILLGTALALLLLGPAAASAASLEPVGNFDQPIYVSSEPGDPNRLFVVEREGTIRSVEAGAVILFADLSARVGCPCQGERGLMSIALDPRFAANGRLYAFYGSQRDGQIHVDELVSADPQRREATFARELLTIPHPGQSTHYGGQIQFGPDGFLYVSTGDGGGIDDPGDNAQDLSSRLGKILRLEPDSGAASIWSYGLRNPFRFSFDRLSGDMVIGDVGQGQVEEIDLAPFAEGVGGEGVNYGWDCREGTLSGLGPSDQCDAVPSQDLVGPVFEYPHADPGDGGAHGCAVIGGYVVRDPSLSDLYGRYLYGDLCASEIRSFALAAPYASDRSEGLLATNLNSFGEDSCGRIYAVSGDGPVWRLTGALPNGCAAPPLPTVGAAIAAPQLRPTYVGIRAVRRSVKRGGRAQITAWVSPCTGRKGDRVKLSRGRHPSGTRFLSRACTARFLPRIWRRSSFRVSIARDGTHLAATSRKLGIRPWRKAQANRHGR
jgi:Glucose / Sorbosone dehydrogenase